MKVDYSRYPEIPEGCLLNPNNRTGTFQVYREGKKRSPGCTMRRESIGSIDQNGVFRPSTQWLQAQRIAELEKENRELRAGRGALKKTDSKQARQVGAKLEEIVERSELEHRDPAKVDVAMSVLCLGAVLAGLGGNTDCVTISDYLTRNKQKLKEIFPKCDFSAVSHDTIREALMLIDPKKFQDFYLGMIESLVNNVDMRVLAADGQAIRATGQRSAAYDSLRGAAMMMSVYDAHNRVTLSQAYVDKKTNEIAVGPGMLRGLNIEGCVVTADAMSCQTAFVEAALEGGANYLLSLKGNQEKSWNEVFNLFHTTHPDQILTDEGEWELGHGRIEQRSVSVIRGRLLSQMLRSKWMGLEDGAVVRVRAERTIKKTKQTSVEERFYITSLPPTPDFVRKIGAVIRDHWAVENNLHWMLDDCFRQDRMQAKNPAYITNRCALNKLCLALLENYRFHLWNRGLADEKLSVRLLQTRCQGDIREAIRCVGHALGWLK